MLVVKGTVLFSCTLAVLGTCTGMKNVSGGAVASLAGPLRWAVDVRYGASVRIVRRPAPGPVPSAEEVAAAVAWNEANHDRIP